MRFYRSVGEIPPKRHVQFRQPDGSLYAEELIGEEGFSFDSALLYHKHIPTGLKAIEAVEAENPRSTHRIIRSDLATSRPTSSRQAAILCAPAPCSWRMRIVPSRTSWDRATRISTKNPLGDEMVYIEQGTGTLETVFGAIEFGPGDHLVIPASVIHRYVLDDAADPVRALILETRGHIGPPRRYLSRNGQFLERAPYCERDLHGPTEPLLRDGSGVEVLVKHKGGMTKFVYEHHPFDVVGWDGCVYPYKFSIHDLEPITGRIHQSSSVRLCHGCSTITLTPSLLRATTRMSTATKCCSTSTETSCPGRAQAPRSSRS